ncbi:hypothetical protein [Streptomyces boetiae]|uniref:hypothetical protein n=1 Tax=Streptomyces boetiae TaxID=3075541 RepID=UPI00288A275F|nr:hypothetical protein [Streptomyces sp. DSM 44917]
MVHGELAAGHGLGEGLIEQVGEVLRASLARNRVPLELVQRFDVLRSRALPADASFTLIRAYLKEYTA